MKGALDQSVFTNPPLVAQSSAFQRLEYILMGWFFGKGTPIDSAFLNSLMGTLSTKKLKKKPTPSSVLVYRKMEVELEGGFRFTRT